MSTQTGIRASESLSTFFGKCRDGRFRLIKVVIEKESLVLGSKCEAGTNWEQDWDRMVPKAVEENDPCYMFYR